MTTLKTITVPALGAEFPAQGGIFLGVMPGQYGQPDYGLILCTDPAAAFNDIPWGPRGVDVPAARSDYDGLANTLAMAEAGLDLAMRITGLSCGGHTDWYLPSRQELRLAYISAPKRFETDDRYWASTLRSGGLAWCQYFDSGYQYVLTTDYECRAVAVRRFALGD